MDISLTVDGHFGLTWDRWSHVLELAERLGFPSLFRSDHYFYRSQHDSLEAFLSFALAGKETSRIRFGPLVTPVTFREPVNVGRMAAQIDVLSGGRFVLGLGAGWLEEEHRAYGIPFPPIEERIDRLEEAIFLMQALWGTGPSTYRGRFYGIENVDCLPKPTSGRVPILIGGHGERRTLPLVAGYANEWNCIGLTPEQYSSKRAVLTRLCESAGRDVRTIHSSMLVIGQVGSTQKAIDRVTRSLMGLFRPDPPVSPGEYRDQAKSSGMIVGSTREVVDRLGELAELGMDEVVFHHPDLYSDELPEYLASEIVPRVAGF